MESMIGKSVKAVRKEMGLSQSTIADFLNVDRTLVEEVEDGTRTLSADMLYRLACLFGVSVEEMEEGNVEIPAFSFAFEPNDLSAEDLEAVSAINRIALNSECMAELLKG